jgi:hypothetical protein
MTKAAGGGVPAALPIFKRGIIYMARFMCHFYETTISQKDCP